MATRETARCFQGLSTWPEILSRFEDSIDSITYRQLVTIDKLTLETTMQSCSDFVESFGEKQCILYHHFTSHVSIMNWSWNLKVEKILLFVISVHHMRWSVMFLSEECSGKFHKIKLQSAPVLLLYQTVIVDVPFFKALFLVRWKVWLRCTVFLKVLPCNIKTGNISSASTIMIMILVLMLCDTSLQRHMAKVHVIGLGEQLKG